jgi:hypothetical protein
MDTEETKKREIFKRILSIMADLGSTAQDNKREMERLSKDPMKNIEFISIQNQMNINKVL